MPCQQATFARFHAGRLRFELFLYRRGDIQFATQGAFDGIINLFPAGGIAQRLAHCVADLERIHYDSVAARVQVYAQDVDALRRQCPGNRGEKPAPVARANVQVGAARLRVDAPACAHRP